MVMVIQAARLVRTLVRTYEKKWSFAAAFLLVFFVSFSTLAVFDIVPEAPVSEPNPIATVPQSALLATAVTAVPELPQHIEIPAIGLSVNIANPTSTDAEVLDTALLSGTVRYPTSAKLGEDGNVIVFGHSSYLPVVNNQAFKAFNGIQKLEAGDRITVSGTTHTYVYEVETVEEKDAESAAIPLEVGGKVLTLVTCDSFKTKTDRFVVTARLVGSNPIGA